MKIAVQTTKEINVRELHLAIPVDQGVGVTVELCDAQGNVRGRVTGAQLPAFMDGAKDGVATLQIDIKNGKIKNWPDVGEEELSTLYALCEPVAAPKKGRKTRAKKGDSSGDESTDKAAE